MAVTFTLRLCFWHPIRMRRVLFNPRVLWSRVARELERWERLHGFDYFSVPEWAWPRPVPPGWWTLYRCLQKDCDGLFYVGEHAPLCTPGEAVRWGLDLPAGWSWCPECGCGGGCGVADSPDKLDVPPPSPWLRALMDQGDAKMRDEQAWTADGYRRILGVL